MKTILPYGLVSGLVWLGLAATAIADSFPLKQAVEAVNADNTTPLELTLESAAFENQELSQGPVRVVASYQPIDYESEMRGDNLQLQVFYNDELQMTTTEDVFMFGRVALQDLDSDSDPEVLVEAFTGGAHCCMAISTYTWQNDHFKTIYFDYLDGGGGRFEDINGDGLTEFLTLDNAFFYAFSSYAGSFPPSLILTFEDGQYTDTTPQFEPTLNSTAWNMFQVIEDMDGEAIDSNGVLAGYVAQKIRLGEFQEGWDFMLARYNADDDWGLGQYNNEGDRIGEYPDFPTALAAFLTELGYLDANGNPQPDVSRLPVVEERVQ